MKNPWQYFDELIEIARAVLALLEQLLAKQAAQDGADEEISRGAGPRKPPRKER